MPNYPKNEKLGSKSANHFKLEYDDPFATFALLAYADAAAGSGNYGTLADSIYELVETIKADRANEIAKSNEEENAMVRQANPLVSHEWFRSNEKIPTIAVGGADLLAEDPHPDVQPPGSPTPVVETIGDEGVRTPEQANAQAVGENAAATANTDAKTADEPAPAPHNDPAHSASAKPETGKNKSTSGKNS